MTEINQLLKTAIQAAKAGEREKAHQLLMQIVEQDEENEMAWLWLSGTVKTKEDRQICLENVLAINPNNEIAKKGLKKIGVAIPKPAPPPPPAEEQPESWTQPKYDLIVPEANDPHKPKFDDIWSSGESLCAYCAEPVHPKQNRCPKCKRNLVGKDPVFPQRSKYLIIWVILRSVNHAITLLVTFFVGLSLSELPAEFMVISAAVFWVIALIVLFVQIGFTAALYFRQIWAYWISILGIVLMVLGTLATAVLSVPVNPTETAPAWLVVPCFSVYILLQVLYVYMIIMAGGDFKRVKRRRVANVDDRIKDPLMLDKAGTMFAKEGRWGTAVLYWQRAVGRAPGNVAALRRLADGYARLGYPERSLDTLNQAYEKTLDPKTRQTLEKQMELLRQKLAQHS